MKAYGVAALLAAWSLAAFAQEPPKPPAEREQFISTRAPVIAFEDVRVIDGTGAPAREGQTVVIVNGRIAAIGPAGTVAIPKGAERRRLTGRTVMPGLVMLHEHMMYFSGMRTWHSQPVSYPRLYLAAGVTTVRTAGSDFPYIDLNLARAVGEGRIAGPRMFVTGPYFNGQEDAFWGDVIVPDEAAGRREAAYWAAHGVNSLKVYSGLSLEAMRGVIAEAKARGVKVTGHLGRTSCRQAAELGIDNIEHSMLNCLGELDAPPAADGSIPSPDPAKARSLIQYLVKRGVALTSTPAAIEAPDAEQQALLHPTALANIESSRRVIPPFFLAAEARNRALEREFVAAGGRMVIGADAENFGRIAGYANHRALELLVEHGHTPLDVIRMATIEGARFLGIAGETGSLEVGKTADLIIVAGDPSARISDIRRVEEVFQSGIGYDPVKLRDSAKGLVGWQ